MHNLTWQSSSSVAAKSRAAFCRKAKSRSDCFRVTEQAGDSLANVYRHSREKQSLDRRMAAMVGVSFHHSRVLSNLDCQPCFHCAETSHTSSPSCSRWENAAGPPLTISRPLLRLRHRGGLVQQRRIYGLKNARVYEISLGFHRAERRLGHRGELGQHRRISGLKDARVYEFSLGLRRAGQNFVVSAAAAKVLVDRKSEFRARAVGSGEFEGGEKLLNPRAEHNLSVSAAKVLGSRTSEFLARAVRNGEFEGGERLLTQYRRGEEEGNAGKDRESKPGGGGRESDESDAGDAGIAAAAKAATSAASSAADAATEEYVERSDYGMDRKSKSSSNSGSPQSPEVTFSGLQDERFLRRAAGAEDADAVLALIDDMGPGRGGVVSNQECSQLILSAIAQNNVELAFSVLDSMRSSLLQRRFDRQKDGMGDRGSNWGWTWPRPDVTTYVALVRGLAASLRVSDAIQTVADMRRRGVPQGDEVPFGKVVNCPTCKTSLAVVQPQHGVQLVPCAMCRYQYELVSGVIASSESESISSDISFWEKGLQLVPFRNRRIPAAVHSIVVRAPDGLAQTHRFATESADVPAQEGERVTMVLASPPASSGRRVGPMRFNARAPGFRPREPMTVTNHVTGQVLSLMRAPPKVGTGAAALDTSAIVPVALLLATTDAASGLVDPSLPRLIAVGAAAALTLGGAANSFLLPLLNQLPQRTVDAIALRQRLLAQHEQLQARLQGLTEAASNEVRMLARMCQLQNKMEAVGEASYSARIERVHKAREGLDERLAARLELMDSYAKVASMIEIEVEMELDVLAAEAASPDASIADQIERLMEVESLQKEWKYQAEANDEVERLLRSSPLLPDSA